jgi:hypothetical protein
VYNLTVQVEDDDLHITSPDEDEDEDIDTRCFITFLCSKSLLTCSRFALLLIRIRI